MKILLGIVGPLPALWPPMSRDLDAPSRRHTLALAAVAGGGVALLAGFVARLGIDEHWPIDHAVRATLSSHGIPKTRAALRVAGSAGTVGVYVPATLMVMALVARRQADRDRLLPLAGSMVGAAAGSLLLKHVVRRPRPRTKTGPINEKPSFPSGHATRASAAALAIAYVLVRERMVPRVIAVPIALAVSAATGISRAYADAHWTTDVVGGWALGGATAAGAALWYERLRGN
jgi:membrane-associated phospholipid phosphatase